MKDELKHLVYGLIDPRTNELRYVGKSSVGMRRPTDHVKGYTCNSSTHNGNWLRSMRGEGVIPSILILRLCESEEQALSVERETIAMFLELGFALTNATLGGEGVLGLVVSAETRKKMSTAQLGRRHTPETKAKISLAKLGKCRSPDTIAKMSAWIRKPVSLATRAKMSASQRRRKSSEETKAKIGAAHRGKVITIESRAKMSIAHIGMRQTKESLVKRSASMKTFWIEKRKALLLSKQEVCIVPTAPQTERKETDERVEET